VVVGNLHLQTLTTIPQILGNENGALLTDEEGGRVRVAADVVGADAQIRDLEALDAVDVEPLVEDAVLDDAVALARGHAAGAKGVPGRLDVAFDPLLDVLDVLVGVLELLVVGFIVRVEPVDRGWLAFFERHAPASVLDPGSEVAWEGICVGG